MEISVKPTGHGIGAEITGIDLQKRLSPEQRNSLASIWNEHLVLLFRQQPVTDQQLMAFAQNFGDLAQASSSDAASKFGGYDGVPPEIGVVSNIIKAGKSIGGLGAGEAAWHSDTSFVEFPLAGSFLHALEVPPTGGDTSFSNMYAAYEGLSEDLRTKIQGRRCLHNYAYTSAGSLRVGYADTADPSKAPGACHPIVRTHPDTGRKALFPGRRLGAYILGLSVDDSERLLDELWEYIENSTSTWTHRWTTGDLIIWDNRCTLHRRESFDPSARRLMHRTQTKESRPVL
jgi:taurine dioxygenase